jgi:hypothetical protein
MSSTPQLEQDGTRAEENQDFADQPQPSIEVSYGWSTSFILADKMQTPTQNEVPNTVREALATQDDRRRGVRDSEEEYHPAEAKEESEKQDHDPAGLAKSDQDVKATTQSVGPDMNNNGFPNMMNLSPGFNNMDYNQMMQFMSSNMGNGMASFNPMMSKSS